MNATIPLARRTSHQPDRAVVRGQALRVIRRNPSAQVRLFCFPYAGAGPSVFNDWSALLPASVELVGVVYPGRECRTSEAPLRDIGKIVDALAEDLLSFADKPFAFFGHSMGAYVSFELARRLGQGPVRPQHLFLSAAGAPHLPGPARIHDLPPREFFQAVLRLNGFPVEVLRHPELVHYALPILRADLTACENYRFVAEAPMQCPMSVFGGLHDRRVDPALLQGWRQLASVAFSLQLYDGDHFYLREHKVDLVSRVARQLRVLAS